MALSPHERLVNDYYDAHADGFYLIGWDPEFLHFGIFDERRNAAYEADPSLALLDRREAILAMTSRVVGSARIQASDTVVDAGCGVGGTSLFIAANLGASVVGLNINQHQLEVARGRAQEAESAARVSFKFADCSQLLPFDDDSVDVVINMESACHFSNRRSFILECARILKPGGRLVGEDWVADDGLSAGDIEEYITPLCDAWVLRGVESMASYRNLIEDAGLHLRMAEHIGSGILPNGYIMRWGYEDTLRREAESVLSEDEAANKELFTTFSLALLSRRLRIGHYVAEKARRL